MPVVRKAAGSEDESEREYKRELRILAVRSKARAGAKENEINQSKVNEGWKEDGFQELYNQD